MILMRVKGSLKRWVGWRDIKEVELEVREIFEVLWVRRFYWR